jgi:hypothetical protein
MIGIHATLYGTFRREGCETAVVLNCKMHVTVAAHKPITVSFFRVKK